MRTLSLCLGTLMLAACGDLFDVSLAEPDTREPDTRQPDTTRDVVPEPLPLFQLQWRPPPTDTLISVLLQLPTQPNHLTQELELFADRSFDPCDFRISHDGVTLEFPCDDDAQALRLPPLREGTTLEILRIARPIRVPIEVPTYPFDATVQATVTLPMADGMTWIGTPGSGLFGAQATGVPVVPPVLVRYAGVATSDPWNPDAREPQSGFITDLARADDRALWVATVTTGVSWFDPGAAPFSHDDDVWVHGQPELATPLASDLAQTPSAIVPDPTNPDGLWVATVNGVYHALKVDDRIDFVRYADGPALSLSVADGRVWVGMSTQAAITETLEDESTVSLPTANGALLVIEPGPDTHDPEGAALRWSTFNEQAVTAILADDDGAWIGTPYRLGRVELETLALEYVSVPELDWFAIVDLAATDTGFWVAARSECEVDGSLVHITVGDTLEVDDHTSDFRHRQFSSLAFTPSGELQVTLLSATPSALLNTSGALSARGCSAPRPTGEVYVMSPQGVVRPFLR